MYQIGPSGIHGYGLFATINIEPSQEIDVAILINSWMLPVITDHCGKWINHSNAPNCILKRIGPVLMLCAATPIAKGQELTANYRDTPWFIQKPHASWK